MTPSTKKQAISLLLSRPEATLALLAGIQQSKIYLADLSLDQKQALSTHPDKRVRQLAIKLLAKGGALPSADRKKVLEKLLPLIKQTGDAKLGEIVFKNQCAKCHTHSGEGEKIGPDLTGMAVHPKEELMVHIFDPNRSVEGNYRVYKVITDDGLVLIGLLAAETKTSIELFDAEGKKHSLQRDEIENIVASTKSLMPEGFEKQLKEKEIVDLMEFLTKRGRFLPLPLGKVATIVSTKGMFYSKQSTAERLIFSNWSPKTFQGIPFVLVDPQGTKTPNVIMLNGPNGKFPPKMPKKVSLTCNSSAKAIHLLSGVSGWGAKQPSKNGTVSMIVRLHYTDGKSEDHQLRNGQHFADYIGQFEVPKSKLAFKLRSQQIRYLAIYPKRTEKIKQIEFIKGPDPTAPIVMAVTIESK